jgi:hypothetical protein
MPTVATLTDVALRHGPEVAKELMAKLGEPQNEEVSDDK